MLETINNFCTTVMDFVLGWSLSLLPRDLILVLVALLTSLTLTGVRVFTTNQDMLKRMKADKGRLKQLIREAKARGDREAVKRHKGIFQTIGMKSFKYEGLPLLASIVPIAFLAVWAFARLGYVAPGEGTKTRLVVDFPLYANGDFVSLVPRPGMAVDGNNWVRRVEKKEVKFDARGRLPVVLWGKHPANIPENTVEKAQAVWEVSCRKEANAYPLDFRFRGQTLDHQLIVDGRTYYSPLGTWVDGTVNLQMDLPEYKFLGFIPSLDFYWKGQCVLPLDAWLLGYLLIVIPLALLLKPILRIY